MYSQQLFIGMFYYNNVINICNYLNELNSEHVINKMPFLHSPITRGYPHVVADNLHEILSQKQL